MKQYSLLLLTALMLALPASAQVPAKQASPKPSATPTASSVPVSVPSEPENTTASFGEWILRCTHAQSTTQRVKLCEVVQSILVQGQSNPIAQIALGRIGADDPIRVTSVLPNNIGFPSVVSISLDEKDTHPAELTWRRCLPGGCFADAEIKEEQLARWRGQTDKGRLSFRDGSGHEVALPFSFRGLAQALDALDKN